MRNNVATRIGPLRGSRQEHRKTWKTLNGDIGRRVRSGRRISSTIKKRSRHRTGKCPFYPARYGGLAGMVDRRRRQRFSPVPLPASFAVLAQLRPRSYRIPAVRRGRNRGSVDGTNATIPRGQSACSTFRCACCRNARLVGISRRGAREMRRWCQRRVLSIVADPMTRVPSYATTA